MSGWLRGAVKQTGITKLQLSRDSGVPRSYIYKLLDGEIRNPSWDIVQKLARALKTSQPERGQLKLPSLNREIVTRQALLKRAIADVDRITRGLMRLRQDLARGLIFKDHRGRKPKRRSIARFRSKR